MWYRAPVFSKVSTAVYIKKKRDTNSGYENRNSEMLKIAGTRWKLPTGKSGKKTNLEHASVPRDSILIRKKTLSFSIIIFFLSLRAFKSKHWLLEAISTVGQKQTPFENIFIVNYYQFVMGDHSVARMNWSENNLHFLETRVRSLCHALETMSFFFVVWKLPLAIKRRKY